MSIGIQNADEPRHVDVVFDACRAPRRDGRSSFRGSFAKYVNRSTAGNSRRTVRAWNSRLPVTSSGCGMVVQQREQISISPARPFAWACRIRCISSAFQMENRDWPAMLPTGFPSSM